MQKLQYNMFYRFWIGMRIISKHLSGKMARVFELVGDRFFDLFLYRGRVGYVQTGVEDDLADGLVRYYERGEYGEWILREITFRIHNRWLLRRPGLCSNLILWSIKTELSVEDGLNVHSILWGKYSFHRKELKPFDLTRLPDEETVTKRNASLKKTQDYLQRRFPVTPPSLSGSLQRSCIRRMY